MSPAELPVETSASPAILPLDPRPEPPPEPDPAECCGSGCDPCIYDYHAEAREAYRVALAAWLARHPESR